MGIEVNKKSTSSFTCREGEQEKITGLIINGIKNAVLTYIRIYWTPKFVSIIQNSPDSKS